MVPVLAGLGVGVRKLVKLGGAILRINTSQTTDIQWLKERQGLLENTVSSELRSLRHALGHFSGSYKAIDDKEETDEAPLSQKDKK